MGIKENWKVNHEYLLYLTGVLLTALITELGAAAAVLLTIGDHNTWLGLFTISIGNITVWLVGCIGLLFIKPKEAPVTEIET